MGSRTGVYPQFAGPAVADHARRWFIVAAGTITGATCSFMACRYCFQNFAKRMVATDKRFAALALVLKHDGIKMLCAIRACPLPYSLVGSLHL